MVTNVRLTSGTVQYSDLVGLCGFLLCPVSFQPTAIGALKDFLLESVEKACQD
jgi:hypothetical protein